MILSKENGDGETLTSKIGDLIIDTISKIHQPIIYIEDSTFFNFSKAQAGGSGPLEPPETNPPLGSIPSPQLNFNFGRSMAANPWWVTINALSIPGPQNPLPKHPKKLFPKFYPDDDIIPKVHINKFTLSMSIMNV